MKKEMSYAEMVEAAAKARKDPLVPRDFITEALERIEKGQEAVEVYPLGSPSLKGVYDIASRLYREQCAT